MNHKGWQILTVKFLPQQMPAHTRVSSITVWTYFSLNDAVRLNGSLPYAEVHSKPGGTVSWFEVVTEISRLSGTTDVTSPRADCPS